MFQPVRMNKLQALVLDEQKSTVIKKLHELGAVQISDCRDKLSHPEWKELLQLPDPNPQLRKITSSLISINKWLDLFESVAPERQDSFFKFLFNPSVPKKIPVEESDSESLLSNVETILQEVERTTQPLSGQLEKVREEINHLQSVQQSIMKLEQTEIDLTYIEETALTSVYLGTILTKNVETITRELISLTNQHLLLEHVPLNPTESLLAIVCLSEHGSSVSNLLRRIGFERIETGGYTGTSQEVLHTIERTTHELKKKEITLIEEIVASSQQYKDRLRALRELLHIEKERADIHGNLALSGPLCMIEGWVSKKMAQKVTKELESITKGISVIKVAEAHNPDEKIPILLENPPFFRNFETLTRMYAPPKYNELDPTIILAITFSLFFAIMLTDVLYGVVTLAVSIPMLRGGGRYNKMVKDFGVILTAGGIVSIFAGAVTGGWFGNLLTDYCGFSLLKKLMIIDPMVDVLTFLFFSIAVGIIHLDIGIIVGIINHLKNREFKKTFTEHFWLILAQLLAAVFYLKTQVSPENNSVILFNALIGIIGISTLIFLILSHKGMFFFAITGAVGDTLSYARLMALGLCTSGIAVTINVLAKMSASPPFIGIILLVLILIVGHIFNWVIQVMGSFVHSIRLHYVEFFGRFYSGGGDEFTPFAIKREITEFKT